MKFMRWWKLVRVRVYSPDLGVYVVTSATLYSMACVRPGHNAFVALSAPIARSTSLKLSKSST